MLGGQSTVKPGKLVHDSDAARHPTPKTASCSLGAGSPSFLVSWRRATKAASPRAVQPCAEPPRPQGCQPRSLPVCVQRVALWGLVLRGAWKLHHDLNLPRLGSCFPCEPVRERI